MAKYNLAGVEVVKLILEALKEKSIKVIKAANEQSAVLLSQQNPNNIYWIEL